MKLHVKYCESFGLKQELLDVSEAYPGMENTIKILHTYRLALACIAYTSFVHDVGNTDGPFAIEMALAPCMIGYAFIADKLYSRPETIKGDVNPYWEWIQAYASVEGGDYSEAVQSTRGRLLSQMESQQRLIYGSRDD